MLNTTILKAKSVGALARYYTGGADDYYAKEGDSQEWTGKGAAALGLSGAVDEGRLRQLLAGEIVPGQQLPSSVRNDSNARIGIDLTFSAPKSVSLQALIGRDPAIIAAHDKAVQAAIDALETRAMARTKVAGKSRMETTGNLIVAKFRHETSREQDAQLHTHAVVINRTQRADGEWRALSNEEIVKSVRYGTAVYRAELAKELQAAGYGLRHEAEGAFELAHITHDHLKQFSARSAQIEAKLAEAGLTRETATGSQKQQAAMMTRKEKGSIDREALFSDWTARAAAAGIDFKARQMPAAQAERKGMEADADPVATAARQAVRYAVAHMTERQSVMDEQRLVVTAAQHAVEWAGVKDIEAEIKRQLADGTLLVDVPRYRAADREAAGKVPPRTREQWIAAVQAKGADPALAVAKVQAAIENGGLVACKARYTTQIAVDRERAILGIEKDGRGAVAPILAAGRVQERLAKTTLNAGQREAVEAVLGSENRVVGIQGQAGTGKSYMLKTAVELATAEGYIVRAVAPYGSQVKDLRESGVDAMTLAKFLATKEKGLTDKTVLVIDEAGLIPTRQMVETMRIAEQAGARIVLVGDTAQIKAIEAGRPFDQLQAAGMRTAHMEEIQRQTNATLKKAVEHAAAGRTAPALANIEAVLVIENARERRSLLVSDYMALSPQNQENTLIVSGTNKGRSEINEMIREQKGFGGKGGKDNQAIVTLHRRDLTAAELTFSKNYKIGDAIQPSKDYEKAGLKRGETYIVTGTGPANLLTVKGPDGAATEFCPRHYKGLTAYDYEPAYLAPGDRVRITQNNEKLGVVNGDRFTVKAATQTTITLERSGKTVELDATRPLHVDYAYASTVHSSQGLTSERVLIEAEATSQTTARDTFYVAISRAKEEARIYTDRSRADFEKAIQRETVKLAALDLDLRENAPPGPPPQIVAQIAREAELATHAISQADHSQSGAKQAGGGDMQHDPRDVPTVPDWFEKAYGAAPVEPQAGEGEQQPLEMDARDDAPAWEPDAKQLQGGPDWFEDAHSGPPVGPDAGEGPPPMETVTRVSYDTEKTAIAARTYLAVPFKDKDAVKEAGGKWDKEAKAWYAPAGADLAVFQPWTVKAAEASRSSSAVDPRAEFGDAIRAAGIRLKGDPIMDGVLRRVPVEGDKGRKMSGAYVGHMNGDRPAGFIENFKTGAKENWKSGHAAPVLSKEDRARLAAEAAASKQARDAERAQAAEKTAATVNGLLKGAIGADGHPYLEKKEVGGEGLRMGAPGQTMDTTNRDGKAITLNLAGRLMVPMQDVGGTVHNMQMIGADGVKMFTKGGRVDGLHTAFGPTGDAKAPLLIAEGMATAKTLHQATGLPVAAALSSGNMIKVAEAFRAAQPDRLIILAGDNDHQKSADTNVGKLKAAEAAERIKGYTIQPEFKSQDKGTDWNDFAKSNGMQATARALQAAILKIEKQASTHQKQDDRAMYRENVKDLKAEIVAEKQDEKKAGREDKQVSIAAENSLNRERTAQMER